MLCLPPVTSSMPSVWCCAYHLLPIVCLRCCAYHVLPFLRVQGASERPHAPCRVAVSMSAPSKTPILHLGWIFLWERGSTGAQGVAAGIGFAFLRVLYPPCIRTCCGPPPDIFPIPLIKPPYYTKMWCNVANTWHQLGVVPRPLDASMGGQHCTCRASERVVDRLQMHQRVVYGQEYRRAFRAPINILCGANRPANAICQHRVRSCQHRSGTCHHRKPCLSIYCTGRGMPADG